MESRLERPPGLIWIGALALAAGVMLLAGVQVKLSGRPWLDLSLSFAWLVTVTVAVGLLARRPMLWVGVVAVAALASIGLALVSRQAAPAVLAAVALVTALAVNRLRLGQGWHLVAAGVVGLSLAAAALLLAFPWQPTWGSWMIPIVLVGVALANLAYSLPGLFGAVFGRPRPAEDWLTRLIDNGFTPAEAQQALVGLAALSGLAALAMAVVDPFLSNLMLAILVGIGLLVSQGRALRQVGALPAAIYGFATLIILMFVASLRFGFLDPLFSQTLSGYLGWDYFSLPRAFDCLVNGVSPFQEQPDPALCGFGPWVTPYVLHPVAAVFPGAVLWALPPWLSYSAFVALSLASLFLIYRLFSHLSDDPLHRSLIFLALFANWPLYLMLWLGQTHIFTVLAYGLVEYWLLRQMRTPAERRDWILIAGILLSLFTKPLIILSLPALLAARLTRRAAVVSLLVYIAVSAVFVLAPPLNPGQAPLSAFLSGTVSQAEFLNSGNLLHWAHIVDTSQQLQTGHRDIHVLSTLLNVVLRAKLVLVICQALTLLTIVLTTWLAFRPQPPAQAARTLALSSTLVIALYYLAYTVAFEHQYPTLAIVPCVFLLVYRQIEDRPARWYLLAGIVAFGPMLLPTIYRLVVAHPVRDILFNFSAETLPQMTIYKSFRVVPVLLMFIFNLLALRRLRLISDQSHPADLVAELEASR